MTPGTHQARLWLDESGAFEAQSDVVVSGGLLTLLPVTRSTFEQRLDRYLDGMPRPFHAAHCRLLSMVALAAVNARRKHPGRAGTPLDSATANAARVLSVHAPQDWAVVAGDFDKGRVPNFSALRRLDRVLTKRALSGDGPYSSTDHALIEKQRDDLIGAVNRLIEDLHTTGTMIVVASLEKPTGCAFPTAGTRYLALLKQALTKGAMLARERAGPGLTIEPRILYRRLDTHPLRAEDVRNLTDEIPIEGLTFDPPQIEHYKPYAHSCLIIADFVCNDIWRNAPRGPLRHPHGRSYVQLGASVKPEIGWVRK